MTMYHDTLSAGGATYTRGGRPSRAKKWAVGMWPGTYRLLRPLPPRFHDAAEVAFEQMVHEVFRDFPTAKYVGSWFDGDVIHIDPVMLVTRRDVAEDWGRLLLQNSIFNLGTGETVTL